MSVKPSFHLGRLIVDISNLGCKGNLGEEFSRVTETIQMGPKNPKINDHEGLVYIKHCFCHVLYISCVVHDINLCDLHTAPVLQEDVRYQEHSTGTSVTGLFSVGCIFQLI